MSTRRGAERYWIKISASQQTIRNSRIHDVTRGAAVTRSFEQLIQFDKDIRDELTSKFFDEGFDLPPFPTENTATLIQEYIEALLKINQVVHSASILSWLKTDHADDTDDHRQLMYIQYLLPGIQDEPSFQTIPRIGTWNKTVPNICHGWWVVWCFRVEVMALPFTLHSFSKHQIELKLFITGLSLSIAAAVKCEIPSTSSRELVHQQMCHISESMFHGSYRLPTEDEGMFTASLEFSNIGTLSSILGIHRVAVECTSIPHEIFKAACEAAQDQNVFEQRRRQAPMLATIKDCDNLLNVEVQPWELLSAEKEDDVDTGVVKENNSTGLEGDTASSPMIYDSIEKLEREKYCLRAELDKFRQETETMKKKIRGMESERRVWQIAKGEVSREISSLIEDVTKERVDKDEIANKLHAAESEIYELRQQIDFKKFHDSKEIENDDEVLKITSALEGLARELHKSKLENYELRHSIQQTKERSRDERKELQKAHDEVVAREFVLLGEVRRLEKELQASLLPAKSITLQRGYSGSGVHTRRYLDKSITKFQHPDPRLHQQLMSLQDRHVKLSKLLSKDPNNLQHLELLGKIEKVILDIVASGKKPK